MARSAMLWCPLALFAALTSLVCADVEFTSPKAGETIAGGTAITVTWKESGDTPAITDFTTYQLFLVAGGDKEDEQFTALTISTSATSFTLTGNQAETTVGKTVGASTKNAYFFKIESTVATGGTITNYSPRFTLSGMTGSFPQNVVDALKNVDGDSAPPRLDKTSNAAAAGEPAANEFEVEYTMQTGLTRFAPMQPIPATKITKKDTKPLHPTSGFTIAKTFLPIPSIQTTITQSQTFSVSSRENTASPAPMPSDDMAKFLARWKD